MSRRTTIVLGAVAVAALALLLGLLWRRGSPAGPEPPVPEPQADPAAVPGRRAAALEPDEPQVRAEPGAPARSATAAPSVSGSTEPGDPRRARRVEVERAIRAAREARRRWQAGQAGGGGGGGTAPAGDAGAPGLSPDYIRERIRELTPMLRDCYDLALHEDPALEGKLVVEFVIGGEPEVGGIVEESRILDESTLRHPVLDECVRETVYMAEFEDPPTGGQVTVRYPFRMSRPSADASPP
jgi:hypothetical protein